MSFENLTLDEIAALWDDGPVDGCSCVDCDNEHLALFEDEMAEVP